MGRIITKPGEIIGGPYRIRAFNQTGAAVTIGLAGALNLDFVNASYVTIAGASTDVRRNVVAVTTENSKRVMVAAAESIASGAEGWWIIEGENIDVQVTGDTNKGEFLTGTDASTGLTPYTLTELEALATEAPIVGIALETRTGAGLVKAIFEGHAWKRLGGNVS